MWNKADKRDCESIAIKALGFLAGDTERAGRFLAITGIAPENLRIIAQEPAFLLAVLDHLLGDEPLLISFAAHNGLSPESVARARQKLAQG